MTSFERMLSQKDLEIEERHKAQGEDEADGEGGTAPGTPSSKEKAARRGRTQEEALDGPPKKPPGPDLTPKGQKTKGVCSSCPRH